MAEFQKLEIEDSSVERIYNLVKTHIESRKKQDPASVLDIELSPNCNGWAEKLRADRLAAKRRRNPTERRHSDSKPRVAGSPRISAGKMDAWAERRMKSQGQTRRKSLPNDLLRKSVDKVQSEWSKDGSILRMRLTRSKSARFSRDRTSPIRRVPETAPEVRKKKMKLDNSRFRTFRDVATSSSPSPKSSQQPVQRGQQTPSLDEDSPATSSRSTPHMRMQDTDLDLISAYRSNSSSPRRVPSGGMQQKQWIQQAASDEEGKPRFSLFHSAPSITQSGSHEMVKKQLESEHFNGTRSVLKRRKSQGPRGMEFTSWSPVCVSDADA